MHTGGGQDCPWADTPSCGQVEGRQEMVGEMAVTLLLPWGQPWGHQLGASAGGKEVENN